MDSHVPRREVEPDMLKTLIEQCAFIVPCPRCGRFGRVILVDGRPAIRHADGPNRYTYHVVPESMKTEFYRALHKEMVNRLKIIEQFLPYEDRLVLVPLIYRNPELFKPPRPQEPAVKEDKAVNEAAKEVESTPAKIEVVSEASQPQQEAAQPQPQQEAPQQEERREETKEKPKIEDVTKIEAAKRVLLDSFVD